MKTYIWAILLALPFMFSGCDFRTTQTSTSSKVSVNAEGEIVVYKGVEYDYTFLIVGHKSGAPLLICKTSVAKEHIKEKQPELVYRQMEDDFTIRFKPGDILTGDALKDNPVVYYDMDTGKHQILGKGFVPRHGKIDITPYLERIEK